MLASFQSKATSLLKQYEFPFIAFLASIISSYIALSYHQPFNVDGITYLNAAICFLQGGVSKTLAVYHWPFYPIMIALVSKITHLHLENAAFLLNCILNTITLITFVFLIKELGGTRRVQYFGLLVILIYPYLNHDRDNILRDFGYYAFAFLSLLFFIRYLRLLNWRYALAWGVSIVTAILFRLEGTIILALAPLVLLFRSHLTFQQKITAWLKINTISFICLAIGIIYLLLHKYLLDSQHLIKIQDIFLQYKPTLIISGLDNKSLILQEAFKGSCSVNSIQSFLTGGIIGIFIQTFIDTIGLLYLILSFHAISTKLIPFNQYTALAWLAYLCINILIVITFLFSQFFLAERYVELLCLLLILGVPFSLASIYDSWRMQKPGLMGKKWLFPLVCILLSISAIDSIGHFGTSKAYITQAGQWIDKNTPLNSRILSNNPQLIYYSHRNLNQNLFDLPIKEEPLVSLQKNNLHNYDYVVLITDFDISADQNKQISNIIKNKPIMVFQNRRGDKAQIYKINRV